MPSNLRADRTRVFEARPDLDTHWLPRLRAINYFREATPAEIDGSFARYEAGDIDGLLHAWATIAEPTRATMPATLRFAYAHAGKGPRHINASVFLDSLSASLRAGERFRERLPADIKAVVCTEFPYLEHRHEHVPDCGAPSFEFPAVFDEYICWDVPASNQRRECGGQGEGGLMTAPPAWGEGPATVPPSKLDNTRARWQLAVALNEVQQSCYSTYAAELFRLPELHRHAERERALARNYFGHWSPRCTIDLWRETIYVLDALNAATFEFVCTKLLPRAMLRSGAGRARWREFVAKLDTPQWLLPVPSGGSRHTVT